MGNIPYVKQYDENGVLLNPIPKGGYISPYNNRASRRARPTRFRGNNKRCSLSVTSTTAFHRVIQLVPDKKMGKLKRIEHYRQK